ncbi:MAG: hypothetical protein AB8B61_04795, partial [Cyclobacteriaceae bacterium]
MRCFVLLSLFLFLRIEVVAQPHKLVVSFYNCENLFDTEDDPYRNDNEFLPKAKRAWTKERYQRKLDQLSRAILASNNWDG